MITQPKLDNVHLSMLEELAKKERLKPTAFLEEFIRKSYNSK